MGYYVGMEIDFTIPKFEQAKCLKEINSLHTSNNLIRYAHGGSCNPEGIRQRWYSWVSNPPENGFSSLVEAFEAWRYEAKLQENGDLNVYQFTGEKWGDDEVLWVTIAPFVAPKGFISVYGEDNSEWHYEFEHGLLFEVLYEKVRVGQKPVELPV